VAVTDGDSPLFDVASIRVVWRAHRDGHFRRRGNCGPGCRVNL